MGIVMSLAMCIGVSPITTAVYLCFTRKKSMGFIFLYLCTSIVLSLLQFNNSNAFEYFDMIPPWLIITTALSYSLLFSSLFRYILV